MTKIEIAELLQTIARYYPGTFKLPKKDEELEELVTSWHLFLSGVDYEIAIQHLAAHIQKKHFPPVISDLLQGNGLKQTVPNKRETQLLLAKLEEKAQIASKVEVKKGLEMMAKALEKGVSE